MNSLKKLESRLLKLKLSEVGNVDTIFQTFQKLLKNLFNKIIESLCLSPEPLDHTLDQLSLIFCMHNLFNIWKISLKFFREFLNYLENLDTSGGWKYFGTEFLFNNIFRNFSRRIFFFAIYLVSFFFLAQNECVYNPLFRHRL